MTRGLFVSRLLVTLSLPVVMLGCVERDENEAMAPSVVADTVYTNGRIYTVDEERPWAEAVAIRDGAFISVGTAADVEAFTGKDTKVIDLDDRFVMPGLHDAHVHLEAAYTGPMLEGATLTFTPDQDTIEKLQAALVAYAAANPELEVLFVEQLPLEIFPNQQPDKAFVDKVVPDRPVVIITNTEHEALLNTKALELEGITADTVAPAGGDLFKDQETGEPTGFMTETAAGRWGWKHFPPLEPEQEVKGARGVIEYLNSVGVTSVKQQHAKFPIARALRSLEQEDQLTMRIALSWTYKGPLEPMPLEDQEQQIADRGRFDTPLINPDFVKMSIDGNFGSTGLVIDPYLVTGGHGIEAISQEDLTADLARLDATGLGLTVHATGDGAARLMLDAMQAVSEQTGELSARHQLAHALSIHPDDISRLVELNLTPEFSPVLWEPNELIDGLVENAGEERMNRLFPMGSVQEAGGRVVIASDGPLFWHDPLETLEVSVTRQVVGGGDRTQTPTEAVDLPTAIRAMTLNSAYLMDQDDSVGSIETGKRADMIVLDQNLFDIDPIEIGSARVLLTVFDGEVVHDASKDPTGEQAIEDAYDVQLDLDGSEGYPGCQ